MPENENAKEKEKKILAALVIVTIFITRFDMVTGLSINGFLLFVCAYFSCFKRDYLYPVPKEIKEYVKGFIIYFLCVIPSILFSDKPLLSFFMFFFLLFQYGSFAVIILFLRQRRYLITMLTVFFLFSGLDCMLALVQMLSGYGLDNRGNGFGGSLLCVADIMCMLLPVTLIIIMDDRFEKGLKKSAAFATLGVIMGLLGNKSRGAWLTELFVVPVAIYHYVKQNRKYLISVLLVTLCVVSYMISNPHYLHRIRSITNTTTDHSNADRIWVWKSAKLMIQDHPLTGTGFSRFQEIYENKYKYEQETQNLLHTHNNFIQVTVESGIVGVVGFLNLVRVFLYTSLRNYRKQANPYDLMIFAVFLAHVCVFGQIDYTFWGIGMQPFFLLLFAILLQLKETDPYIQAITVLSSGNTVQQRTDADT